MIWNVLNKFEIRNSKFEINEVIKILLENRGIKTKKEVEEFLKPKDPVDFTAKDLGIDEKEVEKAVKRINEAIANNEAIIVYGDYDADGICATAILWESLYKQYKNVLPYIPERVSEGYGLNQDSIKTLKSQNPNLKLIVTVDHGITAADKIEYAKKLGIDVIVCDHHQIGKKKPKCEAVVHTDKICAAAIAWFLAKAVNCELKAENYLDLVAIATIADLEPLVGINRSFAKHGLDALRKTKRCGILEIINESGIKQEEIGTYEIGYIIAPRLNAMGRMESAMESLRLLCTKNMQQAKELAAKLGLTNKERQNLTEETSKLAKEMVIGVSGKEKLIFVAHESYNQGIIGLVAGRLVEQFYRPAIVVSIGEVYSKASARSISGFNIIEAIRMQSDLLVDAGGHPMAAGFTVETVKIEELKKRLTSFAGEQITDEMLEKSLKIDMKLPMTEVTEELWKEIRTMSPFGLGNPEPVFASEATVKDFRTVGTDGKHLKLTLKSENKTMSAIAFNKGSLSEELSGGKEVEIAYNLSLNQWNGNSSLELKVKDIRWKDYKH